ncbi:unnamed protein product [Dovyalis caffra]|uniref:F-box domain-containing protein n=1 Tax=Dovyalis caffra TaxID=77055 RepID=A0AAV1SE97_9ROSI|nr:unnamed protein product [Dovyalis caffra]
MESLPREILFDILSRLPTTSLHNAKLVCCSWRNLVQDPVLVDMHFTRQPENNPCLILHSDYPIRNQLYAVHFYAHNENVGMVRKICVPEIFPEFDVIGSCNGWLCLCDSLSKSTFHVYNPFTGDCIELPKSASNSDKWIAFEFGFHPTTKDYKVVMIGNGTRAGSPYICALPQRSEIKILTLGSPAWRSVGRVPYHLFGSPSQVLVNGRLHWVSWPLTSPHCPGRLIVSFDLADERFREVQKPNSARFHVRNLTVLGGCLSVAAYREDGLFEIWIMKEYGVKESWIKEFSIGTHPPRGLEEDVDCSFNISKFYSKRSFVRVLCRLKNGEILLEYKCRALVSYDPRSGTFRDITVQGMPNWFQAVLHIGNHNLIDTLINI